MPLDYFKLFWALGLFWLVAYTTRKIVRPLVFKPSTCQELTRQGEIGVIYMVFRQL